MTRDRTHYFGDDCPGGHIPPDDHDKCLDYGFGAVPSNRFYNQRDGEHGHVRSATTGIVYRDGIERAANRHVKRRPTTESEDDS